jgi:hypothetical protein
MTLSAGYELLDFGDALERLRFDRHVRPGEIDLSPFHIAHCPGDFLHRGRIELYELMWRDKIAGLVVDGDLTIDGNLEDNSFSGSSAFVLARGDLFAHSITLGGAEVVVLGDVATHGPVFNGCGGGRFVIRGSLAASHLVTDSHATIVEGTTPVRSWALGFVEAAMRDKLTRVESYRQILTSVVATEFLDRYGRLDGPKASLEIVEAIRAGGRVLRD